MLKTITIDELYKLDWPLIDVRSPGEYDKGHIPGAVNIPLFNNEERAHVGIVYKQQSREKAIEIGYRLVKPKLQHFIDASLEAAPEKKVIVHCWRGGMRSQAFAQHLHDHGFDEVYVVEGGYKTFRNYLLNFFAYPFKLKVLGGFTGSGKTYIIQKFKKFGEQVIDLEALACHKGSAFGAIGQDDQPSVEQFENNLFELWRKLDLRKTIWVEDESHDIGGVKIPMPLFLQIRKAPTFFVEIPKELRARLLVSDYSLCDQEQLTYAIGRITKRLGGLEAGNAIEHIRNERFYEAALITLGYYDKSYLKGVRMRPEGSVIRLPLNSIDPFENANTILKFVKEHEPDQTYTV
jgi:tRNA 2-selenouridine synthase